jgi:hypothetical protein
MIPPPKYPIDDAQLRSRLLEQVREGIEGAWEKFENYMNHQTAKFQVVQKNKFQFSIPAHLLFKIALALLILFISLLLCKGLEEKFPASKPNPNKSIGYPKDK